MKTCTECGRRFPGSTRLEGREKPVSLRNRKKCLECQPFGTSPYARRYPPEEREGRSRSKSRRSTAKWRLKEIRLTGECPISRIRTNKKKFVVEALGGRCQFCGYGRCLRNLAFHHLMDKARDISSRGFQFGFSKLMGELRKCVLVCHNCHGEIHEGLMEEARVSSAHAFAVERLSALTRFPTYREFLAPA